MRSANGAAVPSASLRLLTPAQAALPRLPSAPPPAAAWDSALPTGGSNPGSKLSTTALNSEQLEPALDSRIPLVRRDRSGWGAGGRRFTSCLADAEKALRTRAFSFWRGGSEGRGVERGCDVCGDVLRTAPRSRCRSTPPWRRPCSTRPARLGCSSDCRRAAVVSPGRAQQSGQLDRRSCYPFRSRLRARHLTPLL